jgi:WD40 repeat protein/serine/threonine protein kinase
MTTPATESTDIQEIRGYVLQTMLGEGGFGRVYRARQKLVNRDVAIKVILPQSANKPEFIRIFEYEAQLVAHLEHPYIVPLFDYWRDSTGAYLVMRFMSGGSLSHRLKTAVATQDEILQWVDQIAAALSFAHRQGVIHRDLKPDNILLDAEGNAYLSDFGIARGRDRSMASERVSGTLAYISPDQLQNLRPTPQADIYSLGIILYRMFAGEHPFAGQSSTEIVQSHMNVLLPNIGEIRPDLPPQVNKIIQSATAKDPAARYADALDVAHALRLAFTPVDTALPSGAVDLDALKRDTTQLTNPYKGLRAFQEYDAQDFFGRSALVDQLLNRLREPLPDARLLVVIGPSGSGKSSVVKAGLLPALRRGRLPGSQHWFIADMFPSRQPFEKLAAALERVGTQQPEQLLKELSADKHGLAHILPRILSADPQTELLLLIDQFEEVFTLVDDENERALFLDSLLHALDEPHSRLRVVLTMRADFYDKPLAYLAFGSRLKQRVETVLPMSPEELDEAITRPADQAGVVFEPGLVQKIMQEIEEQPGILPLLQYALTELFKRREGLVLTHAAYQAVGGVTGALAKRAEALYGDLDPIEQAAAHQMFLRLITLGEGTEDTRRRVRLSELAADAEPIAQQYGDARLLTFGHHAVTREPTVEVAHEALLRTWQRLRDWMVSDRDAVRVQRRLAQAAQQWHEAQRDSGFLAQDAPLDQFETLIQTTSLKLNDLERAFLDASRTARAEKEAEETTRKAREARTAHQAQMLGRMAGAFAVFGVFAILATLLSITRTNSAQQAEDEAWQQFDKAQTQSYLAWQQMNIAQTHVSNADATLTPIPSTLTADASQVVAGETRVELMRLASLSHDLLDASSRNVEMAALIAIRVLHQENLELADSALVQALDRLQTQQIFLTGNASINVVVVSSNGETAASAAEDGTLRIWDVATGEMLHTWQASDAALTSLTFGPDGETLLSGSADHRLYLWNMATGTVLFTLEGHTAPIRSVAFSPDGQLAASGAEDKTIRLWDTATGQPIATLTEHTGTVYSVAFSPDGKTLLSGSHDKTLRVWDVASEAAIAVLNGHTDAVYSVAFSPDGKRALSGSEDHTVRLWELASETTRLILSEHLDSVTDVQFSRDGSTLLSGSRDGTVRLWDVATGQSLRVLEGHSGSVTSVVFSPDRQTALSGSEDATVRIWDLAEDRNPHVLKGHTDTASGVAFNPDGLTALSSSYDGTLLLWEVATGALLRLLEGHTEAVTSVAFSPDGSLAVSGSFDDTVLLWDVATGEALKTLTGHTDDVWSVAFSPDGQLLLSGSKDRTLRLWEVATGEVRHIFDEQPEEVTSVTFSPDGQTVLSGSLDGTVRLWNVDSGALVGSFETPIEEHLNDIWSVDFSVDGNFVLTGTQDGTLWVWDVTTGKLVHALVQPSDGIWTVAFSPDSQMILSGSNDGGLRLWDIATEKIVRTFRGHVYPVWGVAFSPDGHTLMSGAQDGSVRLWERDLEAFLDFACSRVFRDLTPDERHRLGIVDDTPTCEHFGSLS